MVHARTTARSAIDVSGCAAARHLPEKMGTPRCVLLAARALVGAALLAAAAAAAEEEESVRPPPRQIILTEHAEPAAHPQQVRHTTDYAHKLAKANASFEHLM